jgi:hypothetical protein
VIDESHLQNRKYDEQTISTLRGIIIDWIDDSRNADDWNHINHEFDSKKMDRAFR